MVSFLVFPKEENFEFSLDHVVQKITIYDILLSESPDKGKLYIHVRGTKLVFDNHECIKRLVDELNKGEQVKVADLIMILDEDWDERIGFYILNLIYLHYGIKIID